MGRLFSVLIDSGEGHESRPGERWRAPWSPSMRRGRSRLQSPVGSMALPPSTGVTHWLHDSHRKAVPCVPEARARSLCPRRSQKTRNADTVKH